MSSKVVTPIKKRISRACVRCRRHKTKCILQLAGSVAGPPCQKCVEAGVECVLATSNRGGNRRRVSSGASLNKKPPSPHIVTYSPPDHAPDAKDLKPSPPIAQAVSIDDALVSADLHDTSDALNTLSEIAANAANNDANSSRISPLSIGQNEQTQLNQHDEIGLLDYHLVRAGLLTPSIVCELVERYAATYHPFYPIVPAKTLARTSLDETARREPHLLTAILTIAAKDIVNGEPIQKICAQYMQCLVSEIIAGKKCGVEAVEALLLLAEWVPPGVHSEPARGYCGNEDMAAWMHIGLAIRIAYILRLDRAMFDDLRNGIVSLSREKYAWLACYLSDRQISVRIGRPFACRGLEPSILFGNSSLPSVNSSDPQSTEDNDFVHLFRARLELTQIFTNVHEALYCSMDFSPDLSTRMMQVGTYTVLLDDFRGAISAWNKIWGSLPCSSHVRILLQLSYEYLRLYTNAFAFQASALRKTSSESQALEYPSDEVDSTTGTGSLPDARFIYDSIDAAKALLTIINNYIQPPASLGDFPIRFLLYCVNAAVFLYKAWKMNILSAAEKSSVHRLIHDTINRLREGNSLQCDIGARYAHILEVLWSRVDTEFAKPGGGGGGIQNANLENNHCNGWNNDQPQQSKLYQDDQPPNCYDGFSWLDLETISDFVWTENPMRGYEDATTDLVNLPPASIEATMADDVGWSSTRLQTVNEASSLLF
ncbi:hypothetical protein EYB26_007781 [Talaromyces marneffei]|uniref:uncharacterized protein n=1 Tax=Talaromyces marneffei TaxID=37727 RepID=UPI0012A9E92C|nr:uncharacterized protein EYB26_007781 [Talaromyces marneffei]QGA20081.1 hypothetical protein EYB26_007781 [Talaromyces marneffei]